MQTKAGISTATRIVSSPTTYLLQYHALGEIGRERQHVFTPGCTSLITAPTPIRRESTNPPNQRKGRSDSLPAAKKGVVGPPSTNPTAAATMLNNREMRKINNPTTPISRLAFQSSAIQAELLQRDK